MNQTKLKVGTGIVICNNLSDSSSQGQSHTSNIAFKTILTPSMFIKGVFDLNIEELSEFKN